MWLYYIYKKNVGIAKKFKFKKEIATVKRWRNTGGEDMGAKIIWEC